MSVLGVAIFMGCYYWFCRLRFGYTFSSALLQPVTIAVFVGLITGDMANAMKIGAGLQLVYLGVTSTPAMSFPAKAPFPSRNQRCLRSFLLPEQATFPNRHGSTAKFEVFSPLLSPPFTPVTIQKWPFLLPKM